MICNTCHGNGYVRIGTFGSAPCPTCGCSGVDHCCDGDQASTWDLKPELGGGPTKHEEKQHANEDRNGGERRGHPGGVRAPGSSGLPGSKPNPWADV